MGGGFLHKRAREYRDLGEETLFFEKYLMVIVNE